MIQHILLTVLMIALFFIAILLLGFGSSYVWKQIHTGHPVATTTCSCPSNEQVEAKLDALEASVNRLEQSIQAACVTATMEDYDGDEQPAFEAPKHQPPH
ncbi:MAG: hypothetical protein WCT40_02885 [Candidatus Magasanikbacteria bacterium]|jgi:hypothetical protein